MQVKAFHVTQCLLPLAPLLHRTFTITGEGRGTLSCLGGQEDSSIEVSVQGEEDGTVTGIVDIILFNSGSTYSVTGGTTDRNTFSLTGETNIFSVCGSNVKPFTVSGDCGTGVIIRYEEPDVTSTFTGNVECTLV